MATDRMTCMTCTRTKAWPDGFPNRIEATCWDCAWKRHLRDEHPRTVRKIEREVKKRAKRRAERDFMEAAYDHELAILGGLDHPTDTDTESE